MRRSMITAMVAAVVVFTLAKFVDSRVFAAALYTASSGLFGTIAGFAVAAQTIIIGWAGTPSSQPAATFWKEMVGFLHGTVLVSIAACVVSVVAVGVLQWHPGSSSWDTNVRDAVFALWAGLSTTTIVLSASVSRLLHKIAVACAPKKMEIPDAPKEEEFVHRLNGGQNSSTPQA